MSDAKRSRKDRFVGCLLGLAVGDALGAHFEGQSEAFMKRQYASPNDLIDNPPLGELWYTDDTQMAIGIAQTLVSCGHIDEVEICRRFAENYLPQRGYGRGARVVLEAMRAGHDHKYLAANYLPGGSFGNGAAMRVAPVGLMFCENLDKVGEQARLSALPTHVHPLGIEGTQVIAWAVALATKGGRLQQAEFCKTLAARCQHLEFKGPLERAAGISNVDDLALYGNGIEATASAVTAVAAFCLSPESYGETIGNVILLGGDTDTIAAMAGAISGAYLGEAAIPAHLLDKLENRHQGNDFIRELAMQLAAVHADT